MAFADGSNWSTMPITYYLFSRSTTGEIGAGTLPQLENLIRESGSPGWLRVPKRHVASLRSTVPADPADYASNIPSYIRELRAKPSFTAFEKATNASLVILPTPSTQDFSRPLRLAVFDMDSTLIQQEVIDELAAMKNLGSLVSSITERAMRGELDFAASLKERCKLLEGIAAPEVWETLKGRIQFAEGARELCGDLKRRGVKMAVLSGGFQQMADWVKAELDLDYAFANHVSVSRYFPVFRSIRRSLHTSSGAEDFILTIKFKYIS